MAASLNAMFVFQVNGRVLNGASTHNLPQGYYYTLTDAPPAAEASQAAAAAAGGQGGTSAQPQPLASSPDGGTDTQTDPDPQGDRAHLASSSQPPSSSAEEEGETTESTEVVEEEGQRTESIEVVGSQQQQRLQEEEGLESGKGQSQSSGNAGSSEMRASQPGVVPFNQSSSQSTSQSVHQSVNPFVTTDGMCLRKHRQFTQAQHKTLVFDTAQASKGNTDREHNFWLCVDYKQSLVFVNAHVWLHCPRII